MQTRTSITKSPHGGYDITIVLDGQRHTWWLLATKRQAHTFATAKLLELGGMKAVA